MILLFLAYCLQHDYLQRKGKGESFLKGLFDFEKNETVLPYFRKPSNLLRKIKSIFKMQNMSGAKYGLIEKRNGHCNRASTLVSKESSDTPILIQ